MGRKHQDKQAGIPNPAKKCYQWKAGAEKGYLERWDKDLEDNICVRKPLKFIFLEERQVILGWSDSNQCSLYSNEIAHLGKKIRLMGRQNGATKTFYEGFWKEGKETIKAMGGKFCHSIYAMAIGSDNEDLEDGEIFRFTLKGAGLKAWYDLEDKSQGLVLQGPIEQKKGAVKYYNPVFEVAEISNDDDAKAEAAEVSLSAFFKERDDHYSGSHSEDGPEQEAEPEKNVVDKGAEVVKDPF